MILSLTFLIFGFILLVKGAGYLVEGASALAVRFAISEIMIGLTIVAFGTSAPELVVSITASIGDKPDISLGNVIGSNIVNILLILGISGVIYPLSTKKNTVWKEIPFSLMAAAVILILCNDYLIDNTRSYISRSDGIILLLFFIIYLTYTFGISKINIEDKPDVKHLPGLKITIFIVGGLVALFFGGQLVVNNGVKLARSFGVSDKLIGLSIIAIGTSLPELFTSAVAAYKKRSDIAVGNIVGSNIFNLFFILGISSLIRPIDFDSSLDTDIMILIAASLLLFLTMFTGKKRTLDKWEAVLFLFLFAIYNIFLFIRR
jgi:cation:H+ antiporter